MTKKTREKLIISFKVSYFILFFTLLIFLGFEILTFANFYQKKKEISRINEKLLEEIANLKLKTNKEETKEGELLFEFQRQNPILVKYLKVFSEKFTQKNK
jgi:sulfite exporter TauE/SafE